MFSSSRSALGLLLLLAGSAHAHPDPPRTPEQLKVYSDLQAAAYLCAPAVAAYTAERQRVFAQKVLAGETGFSSLGASDLFDGGEGEMDAESRQKLLSCAPAEDSKIRNNTCVLGGFCFLSLVWYSS